MKAILRGVCFNLFIIAYFVSCTGKQKKIMESNCLITYNQLFKSDSIRLQISKKNGDGIITQLVDKSNDSSTGGVYYFYPDGTLQSYKFFTSKTRYQYNEEYDSLGNVILIEGSPLVLHTFRKIDSSIVRFTFLFSTLNKEYRNLNIRTNLGVQFNAELFKNSIFTNVQSVTFDLPVARTFSKTEIYTNCLLVNSCLDKQWALKDTLSLKDATLPDN